MTALRLRLTKADPATFGLGGGPEGHSGLDEDPDE